SRPILSNRCRAAALDQNGDRASLPEPWSWLHTDASKGRRLWPRVRRIRPSGSQLTTNDPAHDRLLEIGRRSRIAGSSDGRRHLGSVGLYETAKADGSWFGQRETWSVTGIGGRRRNAATCATIWIRRPRLRVIVCAEINPDYSQVRKPALTAVLDH